MEINKDKVNFSHTKGGKTQWYSDQQVAKKIIKKAKI